MSTRLYGERVRDARVIQGLKSKDVAEEARITAAHLTNLEHTEYTDALDDTAEGLARALHFPIEFLTTEPAVTIRPGVTLFRARRSMTRREEEQVHAWSHLYGEVVVKVAPKVEAPALALPSLSDVETPVAAAEATRRAFGVDVSAPIPHLMRLAERGGIPAASLDFESDLAKHDAFSCWVVDRSNSTRQYPLMVVRAMDSWEKTRFSVAHEIAHLVMHRDGAPDDVVAEQEAHDFARNFILPPHVLADLWPAVPTLTRLLEIKSRYGLSLAALVEHAFRSGLINKDQRASFYKQLSNRRDRDSGLRWREREPGAGDREPERPRLLATILEAVHGEGVKPADLSASAGYWPGIYLRRALASQMWSADLAKRPAAVRQLRPSLAPTRSNVVSFKRRLEG